MNIFLTILIAILCFGVIIFIHELGHFLVAKLFKFRINEFALGMGPTVLSVKGKETKYALRLLPIGGFVAMEGEDEESSDERAFNNKPAWQRFLVCIAGATMNLILGFIIMVIITSCFANLVGTRKVAYIAENSAFSEKLQVGDEIISVNNLNIFTTTDVYYEFTRDADKSVDMIIRRNNEKIEINNIPLTTVIDEEGNETVSFDLRFYGEKKNVLNVLKEGAIETVSSARLVFLSLVDLIRGRYSVNELSGPVGVTSVISQAASYGIDSLLNVVAFISINVGVFNLLPFPALDGGRSIVLIGEMITKKHLNRKVEAIINVIGLGILLLVMLFATYNDILKLF